MRPLALPLLVVVCVASAAAVDWSGASPLAEDRRGDQREGGTDLKALFAQRDGSFLALRVESYNSSFSDEDMVEVMFDTDSDLTPDYSTNLFLDGNYYVYKERPEVQRISNESLEVLRSGGALDVRVPLSLMGDPPSVGVAVALWSRVLIEKEVVDRIEPYWSSYPPGSGAAAWTGTDWTGVPPLASDPAGDSFHTADLAALYAKEDADYLYLRLDLYNASADPSAIIEFLFDTDLNGKDAEFSTNLHPSGEVHLYADKPSLTSLPTKGLAFTMRPDAYEARIPLAPLGRPKAMLIGVDLWERTDVRPFSFVMDLIPLQPYPPGSLERWSGTDWTGIAPIAVDPRGDNLEGPDLKALYVKNDTSFVYVRADLYNIRTDIHDNYEFLFDVDGDNKPDYSTNLFATGIAALFKDQPTLTRVPEGETAVASHDNVLEARVPLEAIGRPESMRIGLTVTAIMTANRTEGKEPSDTLLEPALVIPRQTRATETDYLYIVYVVVIIGLLAFIVRDVMAERAAPKMSKKKGERPTGGAGESKPPQA